ncbi:hypothetical protein EI94DRAFT_1726339 [Lactarius quietus]|nr:hypothetical protein EI94DRAFT_1726339 [Lactarius quietus]
MWAQGRSVAQSSLLGIATLWLRYEVLSFRLFIRSVCLPGLPALTFLPQSVHRPFQRCPIPTHGTSHRALVCSAVHA